jgi:hypothetical protein
VAPGENSQVAIAPTRTVSWRPAESQHEEITEFAELDVLQDTERLHSVDFAFEIFEFDVFYVAVVVGNHDRPTKM